MHYMYMRSQGYHIIPFDGGGGGGCVGIGGGGPGGGGGNCGTMPKRRKGGGKAAISFSILIRLRETFPTLSVLTRTNSSQPRCRSLCLASNSSCCLVILF